MKSSWSTPPFYYLSPILSISCTSWCVTGSSRSLPQRKRFECEIRPLSSSSYILNVFDNSWYWSLFSIYSAMSAVNSSWSMAPEPSLSTLVIIYLISSLLRKIPRAFNASFNSWISILPDLSLSNNKKAFSISSIYSCVRYLVFLETFLIIFFLFIVPSGICTCLYSMNSSSFISGRFFLCGWIGLADGIRCRLARCIPMLPGWGL